MFELTSTFAALSYSDTSIVYDPPPVTVEVEPGPYWIDGPSIPIYPGQEPGWHQDSLQTIQVKAWGQCGCENVAHTMEPVPVWDSTACGQYEGLKVGKLQIKVCVGGQLNGSIYLRIIRPDNTELMNIPINPNQYCTSPFEWDIHLLDCGTYAIQAYYFWQNSEGVFEMQDDIKIVNLSKVRPDDCKYCPDL